MHPGTRCRCRNANWRTVVGHQFEIGQDRGEEEETPAAGVDEHGVLADPPEAGAAREVTLQERGGVGYAMRSSSQALRSRATRRARLPDPR